MKRHIFTVGKYSGYTLFALFFIVVTTYMVFPFDRLKTLIARELTQGGRYEVSIGSVSPAFLMGITLKDVVFISPPEKPGEKKSKMEIERATVKFGIFSLLKDSPDVSFDVEAFGGRIQGETQKIKKTRKIKVDFEDISFKQIPGISKAIDLPMAGSVTGRGNIKIPPEGYRMMEGKLTLNCKNCSIGDGKTLVKPKFARQRPGRYNPVADKGVTLPKIRLGRFGGDINIKKGKAEFSQFEALSPDGEAKLIGYVMLREPIIFSTVQAVFKLKFSEEFKKRKPKIMGIEASMARGKRDDGLYGMCITRRLKNLRFKPCRFSAAERGKGRGPAGRFGGRTRGRTGRRPPTTGRRKRPVPPAPRRKRPPRPPTGKKGMKTGGEVDNY